MYDLDEQNSKFSDLLPKVVIFICLCLATIAISYYLNQRWSRIRDIRRQSDAQAVLKAIDYYKQQKGAYPSNPQVIVAEGELPWDDSSKHNQRKFLQDLIDSEIMPAPPFDPINDNQYHYHYLRVSPGQYGCVRETAIFQITKFELEKKSTAGGAKCSEIDFTKGSPDGYTWMMTE